MPTKSAPLRLISYGLYILTTQANGELNGASVSWLTQISFEPKLVLVALRKGTRIQTMVRPGGYFVIHIPGRHQAEMVNTFFKPANVEGGRLSGYAYRLSPHSCPILVDAIGWFECRVVAEHGEQGDHVLVIGEVVGGDVRPEAGEPLALRDTPWSYGG